MENQLKFFPRLSLKEIALRTTAVLLWSDSQLFPILSYHFEKRFGAAQDRVAAKVSQLELPESLTKQVADVVRPVGLEIKRWKHFFEYRIFAPHFQPTIKNPPDRNRWGHINSLLDSTTLCWTTAGRIDYQKTVKELHCNTFGVVEFYEIACDCCLEDRIALLWERLSREAKEYYSYDGNIRLGLSFQWPHILKGEHSKLDEWSRAESELNFNQYSFERLAKEGKKSVAEYFYLKLTPEEREASVMRSFLKLLESIHLEYNFDNVRFETFYYLLTLMTPEQQMEMLKAHPIHLFFCFFDMIWPDLFLENVPLIWKHLPSKDYTLLLQVMIKKIRQKGVYSPELFMKFFIHSPPDFKKCILGHESESDVSPACSFLSVCFTLKDPESVKALFRSLDVADRVKLVFHRSVLNFLLQSIIRGDHWLMFELCVAEAALPYEEKERLKDLIAIGLKREATPSIRESLKRRYEERKRGQKRKLENSSPE